MNKRRVARSLEFNQEMYSWNESFADERLALHLDGKLLAHLLDFGCLVVIVRLRALYETVEVLGHALLVPGLLDRTRKGLVHAPKGLWNDSAGDCDATCFSSSGDGSHGGEQPNRPKM